MNIITGRKPHAMSALARAMAGCALVACIATGCTSARSNLGTSDSSCFLALPAATTAVGSHSRFVGVHLFTLSDLRHQAPKLFKQVVPSDSSTKNFCVFAFTGHFISTSVSEPHGRSAGGVAIVVLTRPANKLLGTVVLSRLPLRFGHSHIG